MFLGDDNVIIAEAIAIPLISLNLLVITISSIRGILCQSHSLTTQKQTLPARYSLSNSFSCLVQFIFLGAKKGIP